MALHVYIPDVSIAQTVQNYARIKALDVAFGLPEADAPLAVIDIHKERVLALECQPHSIATASHHVAEIAARFPQAKIVALPQRIDDVMHVLLHSKRHIPCFAGWSLNADAVEKAGEAPIHLTDKEADVLRFLLTHRNELVTRDALLQHVWHYEPTAQTNTLETHIYRLRNKLSALNMPQDCGILTKENGYFWLDAVE